MREVADHMSEAMRLRGPDDHGSWCDEAAGVALAHRRLSIIDLSPLGKQPMQSRDGRFCISYNGEIYNFQDVRSKLESAGVPLRSHSDTEVLVEGIAHWGLRKLLPELVGMFAFAIWDREERTLSLVRDRLGIKPLYYGYSGGGSGRGDFLFGSDLAALERYPEFRGELSRDAISLYLRYQYVPSPHSVYRNIQKLPPGHLLEMKGAGAEPVLECWWDAEEVALAAQREGFAGDESQAVDGLESVLGQAVTDRMISDVPLGAFLSGGIDSSAIVALMQAKSDEPVQTFTIGFTEDAFDEASHARAISEHLGTKHTELYMTESEALDAVPDVAKLWTEPFADPSQLPTYLVSRIARGSVTVSLSGDGGDELFGGYDRYAHTQAQWQRISQVPALMRAVAGALRGRPMRPILGALGRVADPLLQAAKPTFRLASSIDYRAQVLAHRSLDELYRFGMSIWKDTEGLVLGADEPRTRLDDVELVERFPHDLERMMLLDTLTYLPGDILEKVDRASMGVSLEARVPILDHRVYEYAWRLPPELRVRKGIAKWPLREVLARHVPRSLFERPKQGFGAPVESWLRGPLREWAETLLDPCRVEAEGILSRAAVSREWADLQAGHPAGGKVWAVLMLQSWLDEHRRFVSVV
jgi:asparagine synthase (glutamine-hydrolysing)